MAINTKTMTTGTLNTYKMHALYECFQKITFIFKISKQN